MLQFPRGSRHLSEVVERIKSPRASNWFFQTLCLTAPIRWNEVDNHEMSKYYLPCPKLAQKWPSDNWELACRVLTTELQVRKGTCKIDAPQQKKFHLTWNLDFQQVHINHVNWSTKHLFTRTVGKMVAERVDFRWMTVSPFTQQSCSGSSSGSCSCFLIEGSDERSPPERTNILCHLTLYHRLFYHKMWVNSLRAGTSSVHCLV